MEITLDNLLQFLKKSELYRNFLENSDDSIIINPKHNRESINIQSFEDLCNYLDIYRYWMLDESIKEIFYDYVKNNNINMDYLKDNFKELSELLQEFEHIKNFNEDSLNYAVKKGNLYLLKYLHENKCPFNEEICNISAKNGHLNCLIYLHENKYPWNEASNYAAMDI